MPVELCLELVAVVGGLPMEIVNLGCTHTDCILASHIPHDAFGPEVVFTPQMEDLLFDLGRCLIGR